MASPPLSRVVVDVVGVLLDAWQQDAEVDGWSIMKAVKRSGPTVYGALDRLEDAGWITGSWERRPTGDGRPRRRLYRLTAEGVEAARQHETVREPGPALRQLRPHPGLGFAR